MAGVTGLLVPETGLVDYGAVCRVYAERIARLGGEVKTGARVHGVRRSDGDTVVETSAGEAQCSALVNCAGLQSDRVACLCGIAPEVKIVPFRGEYYQIQRPLVKMPVYPVPDPRFHFLGVHFIPTLDGRLEAGPNAVLALKREGYERTSFSLRDIAETLGLSGLFWRVAGRFWRTGLEEMARSYSRRRFAAALRQLVPETSPDDLVRAGSGVRAQAVDRQGRLFGDFRVAFGEHSVHVFNAPSPGATAAISIGRHIAERVAERF